MTHTSAGVRRFIGLSLLAGKNSRLRWQASRSMAKNRLSIRYLHIHLVLLRRWLAGKIFPCQRISREVAGNIARAALSLVADRTDRRSHAPRAWLRQLGTDHTRQFGRQDGGASIAGRPRASWMARQTCSGVAGMSIWRMPHSDSASTRAFITDGSAPAQPASPQPFAPNTLVVAGTGWNSCRNIGASSARGKA